MNYLLYQIKKFIAPKIPLFLTGIILAYVLLVVQATNFGRIQDGRMAKYFYDILITLPNTQLSHTENIYQVYLDETSLPPDTCWSPVDRGFLTKILAATKKHSPKAIGLHLLLNKPGEPIIDAKLAMLLQSLGNVVLLDSKEYPTLPLFRKSAFGNGTLIYQKSSGSEIQRICNKARSCGKGKFPLFHRKLWQALHPNEIPTGNITIPDWIDINFLHLQENQPGNKRKYSAREFLEVKAGELEKNALILIGPEINGLYAKYETPIQSATGKQVSALNLVAAVMGTVMEKNGFYPVPLWLEGAILIALFCMIAFLANDTHLFRLMATGVLFAIIWTTVAGGLFAYAKIKLNTVFPVSGIVFFSLVCFGFAIVQARFVRQALETELERKQYASLVDEFHEHSIFNALGVLKYFIKTNNPNAGEFLQRFATILRNEIDHKADQSYSLKEQWQFIDTYLELFMLKSEDTIHYKQEIDPNLVEQWNEIRLPWKLFFPLVENAVKYTWAISTMGNSGKLKIILQLINVKKRIVFRISNPFLDGLSVDGTGTGIRNLRQRLAFIYPDKQWKLEFSKNNQNWIAELSLPL